MTGKIALFDTNAGFLQWLGVAANHEAAIRAHLDDIGYSEEVEHAMLAIDVSEEQAAAIDAWASAGSNASEYPDGLPKGESYSAEEVADMMDGTAIRDDEIKISADFSQASSPLRYKVIEFDDGNWRPTPYQVADAGHERSEALNLVHKWLEMQG